MTTADGQQRLARQPELRLVPGAGSGTVAVRPEKSYQRMRGFGASFTDSAATLVQALPHRDELMRKLFDRRDGIGLSSLRQPMGSSDFSPEFGTYDDLPPGNQDWQLAKFSVDRDRATVIPLLRQASGLNSELNITATPWTPPAWMKDRGSLTTMNHPSRAEQRKARRALLSQTATVFFALLLAIGARS